MKLFNNLPDDCLILIFLRVPLSDRIGLHRVCPRWRSLQPLVTATAKSLILHIATTEQMSQAFSEKSYLDIQYLDPLDQPYQSPLANSQFLTLPVLTANITTQLITLLPNIESLQLNFKHSTELTPNICFLNQLLQGWSDKLVTFEFNCWDIDPGSTFRGRPFGHTLNIYCPNNRIKEILTIFDVLDRDCLKLENISINAEEEFGSNADGNFSSYKPFGYPSLMQRLKIFRFNSYDHFEYLYESLTRYATGNATLKQIFIGKCMQNGEDVPNMYDIDYCLRYPELLHKFTRLPGNPSKVLELSKFTNLTTLLFGLDDFLGENALLAKMTNLVHLVLHDYIPLFENTLQHYEQTPSYTFHHLPTVKVLCIQLTRSRTELQSKHWSWILPSIQLVELQKFDYPYEKDERDWEIEVNTMKNTFQLLKQCRTVKRVIMNCFYSEPKYVYPHFNVKFSNEWSIEDL